MNLHINAVGAVMGGAARHLPPFLAALATARPDWNLHVWTSAGVPTDGWPAGVRHEEVPRLSPLQRVRFETIDLIRALRRDRADALLNLTNSGPLRSPVPSILYQRNPVWFDKAWIGELDQRDAVEARARRWLTFAQARAAAAVIVPSGAMAEYLLSWPGWPRSTPLRVVPHAVDVHRFGRPLRTWPPDPDRPLRLVSVSHASPHKDQLLLIDLVRLLADRGHDVNLTLTITPDDHPGYVTSITDRIVSLRVDDRVDLGGRVADPERLYDASDIALLPSRTESFGFPIVEAMAAGVPLVSSSIASSLELAGPWGAFFPTGDADAAADAVEHLLATARETMSARLRAAQEAAATYTWDRNAQAVASIVEAARSGTPRVAHRMIG